MPLLNSHEDVPGLLAIFSVKRHAIFRAQSLAPKFALSFTYDTHVSKHMDS